MTLPRAAPGFSKPLAILPVFAACAAVPLVLSSFSAPLAPSGTARSGLDGKFVTRAAPPRNLPDRLVYAKLPIQVLGVVPRTRNGKTGQV
jgi:hypothetical protein